MFPTYAISDVVRYTSLSCHSQENRINGSRGEIFDFLLEFETFRVAEAVHLESKIVVQFCLTKRWHVHWLQAKTRMISRSIDFNEFECVPIYTGRDVKTSRELVSIVETMRGSA